MFKFVFFGLLLSASACGSDSGSGSANPSGSGACPDVSGAWTVTQHCDSSLVGMTLNVRQTDCALSFASPFDQFMGSVTADDKITLSGPQSCTGSATATAVSMICSPGTCRVTLAR